MELMEIIKTRRSIRKYLDKDVPDNIIEEAIEAASYAPNGGNYQGWKYVVIKNKEVLENIAKAVMDKLEAMVTWPEAEEYADIFARYKNNATFFKNAPRLHSGLFGQVRGRSGQGALCAAGEE